MESRKDLSKYLHNMDTTNIDLLDKSLINDSYSNFSLFGIGKPTAKQVARKESRVERRAEEKKEFKKGNIIDKVKVIGRKVVRFNPVVAPMRASALAGIRVNIFGISVRLYPAFLTPEEAKAKKIRIDAIAPAKKDWVNVSEFWKKIGGNVKTLEDTIKSSYNKPVLNITKKSKARTSNGVDGFEYEYNNVTGVDDIAAAISYGLPILTTMGGLIKDSMKNPFEKANPNLENVVIPEPTTTPEELQRIAEDKTGNGVLADGEDTILGMPKGLVIGLGITLGVAILGFVGYKIYKAKKG